MTKEEIDYCWGLIDQLPPNTIKEDMFLWTNCGTFSIERFTETYPRNNGGHNL